MYDCIVCPTFISCDGVLFGFLRSNNKQMVCTAHKAFLTSFFSGQGNRCDVEHEQATLNQIMLQLACKYEAE